MDVSFSAKKHASNNMCKNMGKTGLRWGESGYVG
jgi:hypothetical protein